MNNFEIQVIERLARVEEQIGSALTLMINHSERTDDQELRIRALEHGRAKLVGVVAAITFVATSIPSLMVILA